MYLATFGEHRVHVTNIAHHSARIVGSRDRKSTRLNSSHGYISYAVFCLKTNNSLPSTTYAIAHVQALAHALHISDAARDMEWFDLTNISTPHVVDSIVVFRDGVLDQINY